MNPIFTSYKNILWRLPHKFSLKQHVFVMGAPRSGTTLLQTVLSSHPEIAGSQRESGIFTYQNIFNSKRQFCDIDVSTIEGLYQSCSNNIEFFDAVAEIVIRRESGQIFLEKTPQHILQLPFLMKHFPNSKFICIYRDGRDAFCSASKHPGVPQGKSVKRYAKYWKKCIRKQLAMRGNSNLYEVGYEALTTEPEVHIRAIMIFLGLEYYDFLIDPTVYSNDRRSRKKEFQRLNQKITPSSANRWLKELSNKQKHVFHQIALKELEALGYLIE